VQYDDAGRTRVTLGGTSAAGPVTLGNVAAGALSASSAEAVNGAQLYATNTAVAGNATAIASNTALISGLSAGLNGGTIGLVQQAGGVPGTGAITIGASTGGSAVSVAGTDGDRQLKHVAAGTDDADAANVGQLKAIGTTAANAVQYDDAGRTRVTLGGTSAAGPVTLGNVAAGALSASSAEAVNGAQLYATNTAVAGNTTAIASNTASIAGLSAGLNGGTIGLVQQAGGVPGTGAITIGASTGGSAVSVAGTDGDRQLKHVAAGTDDTDAANVGQLRAISAIAGSGVQYDDVARSSVTLGGLGATVAVRLTNVAPGALNATSADAVTGAQLYATNLAVEQNKTAITNLSSTVADIKGSTSNPATPGQPGGAVQVPESLRQFTSNSSGVAASATGSEAIAIGAGAQASGKAAVAIGAGSSAVGNGSVALGQGSVAQEDNTVSVGNSAAGLTRTISNVSAGVAPTDAVNVRQLNDSINSVRAQIEHDRADANGGTASAVAIASLPQAPAPGKSVVSVGGGTYAGQSAVAVGMSTYAGRWIVKASGSTNTRGTVAAGLGAGFVW
ncbi:YadA family autotransporter adhesin, partial [Burkholderia cepacia]|uniref:YadA family autotransporter adhesin n=1 Tax=Burkholderia cepacia TaxID=292 RepID=UPI001E6106A6